MRSKAILVVSFGHFVKEDKTILLQNSRSILILAAYLAILLLYCFKRVSGQRQSEQCQLRDFQGLMDQSRRHDRVSQSFQHILEAFAIILLVEVFTYSQNTLEKNNEEKCRTILLISGRKNRYSARPHVVAENRTGFLISCFQSCSEKHIVLITRYL